jgi:scyllo-inositol 2-dehydrogenase (NADP+)
MEFDGVTFQAETSRVCRLDRPRWWVVGTDGCLTKTGVDPQEDALRAGDLGAAREAPEHRAVIRTAADPAGRIFATVKGSWDTYYANVAAHLAGRAALEVTAEQAREVVRVLEAATRSSAEHVMVEGPWGG